MKLKPIVKYAGGKSKLLPQLSSYFPDFSNIKYYYEPFVGGGAIFFHLCSTYHFSEIYINDKVEPLMNLYSMFYSGSSFEELKKRLDDLIEDYWKTENKQSWYYNLRDSFNTTNNTKLKAIYFLILNKLCFNGLCRFNKSEKFNVPYGKYKNPKFYDVENFNNIREYFKTHHIFTSSMDYYDLLNNFIFNRETFVYIDPPYLPINKTSNFTSYTGDKFEETDVIKLKDFINKLNKYNCKIMMSHQAKNDETNKLIYDVFSDYNFHFIEGTHAMANKNQTNIKEFIITNY